MCLYQKQGSAGTVVRFGKSLQKIQRVPNGHSVQQWSAQTLHLLRALQAVALPHKLPSYSRRTRPFFAESSLHALDPSSIHCHVHGRGKMHLINVAGANLDDLDDVVIQDVVVMEEEEEVFIAKHA